MTLTGITPYSSELIFTTATYGGYCAWFWSRYLTTRRIVLTGQASAQAFRAINRTLVFSLPLPIRMLVQIPVYSISCSANQRSITMRFRMLGMLV